MHFILSCVLAFIFGIVCSQTIKPWWMAIIIAMIGGYFMPGILTILGVQ